MSRPADPARRSIKVADWPQADRAAWDLALLPADVLDPCVGYANRWRRITQESIENGYGRWLGWLDRVGELDRTLGPGERVSETRVRAYMDTLRGQGLADYSVAARLQQLGNALKAMAPEQDWHRILRASARVHSRAVPLTNVAAKLQRPDDVFQLGLDLMHAAEHHRFRTPCDRATLFRDGLLIAFLIHRPVRLKNLASMTIGRQLQRLGEGWWVSFSDKETKASRAIEFEWPAVLQEALERYLEVHRKVLLSEENRTEGVLDALWVARRGSAMGYDAIAVQIASRTSETFGRPINPHAFRHIAATAVATADPENVTSVTAILGHTTLATSEKYYNKATMIDAVRRYHTTVTAVRKGRSNGRAPTEAELDLTDGSELKGDAR